MAGRARKEDTTADLLAFALSLPEAWEDHPWGERVAKVRRKVFVFFGVPEPTTLYLGVKLRASYEEAMTYEGVEPMGYGLGRHGWLSCRFIAPAAPPPPADRLQAWITESYRLVAPKKLAAELEQAR